MWRNSLFYNMKVHVTFFCVMWARLFMHATHFCGIEAEPLVHVRQLCGTRPTRSNTSDVCVPRSRALDVYISRAGISDVCARKAYPNPSHVIIFGA